MVINKEAKMIAEYYFDSELYKESPLCKTWGTMLIREFATQLTL